MSRRTGLWIGFGVGAMWLAGVSIGLAMLMDYDNRPGVGARAPKSWPADSTIARAMYGPTLVMLAHPRCDCTRASLSELGELLARAEHKPRTIVVFIKPARTGAAWEQSEVWRMANAIRGVQVIRDDSGTEATRFGVETSGQTLLYGADGTLLFSGGSTASRGKTGNSVGRMTLLALLRGESSATASTPVFGCPLFGPGDKEHPGDHRHGV